MNKKQWSHLPSVLLSLQLQDSRTRMPRYWNWDLSKLQVCQLIIWIRVLRECRGCCSTPFFKITHCYWSQSRWVDWYYHEISITHVLKEGHSSESSLSTKSFHSYPASGHVSDRSRFDSRVLVIVSTIVVDYRRRLSCHEALRRNTLK
jgi:hypothetical protein